MNLADLAKPFPPDEIEWRVGSTDADKKQGLALAYLTARHVMDRLDEVCGPEGWQSAHTETPKGRVLCTISILTGNGWVGKSDGAGDSDVEAEKGAISDALKRAAVSWGIGRYLYDLGAIWVGIEPAGRSFKIKASEKAKLVASLGGKAPLVSQPKQEPAPRQKTVAERKGLYADLKADLMIEASRGSDALARFMTDERVKAELTQLGSYEADFRNEAREIYQLALETEKQFGAPPKSVSDYNPPSFEPKTLGDQLDAMPLYDQEQDR